MTDNIDVPTALVEQYAATVERLLRGDAEVDFPIEAASDAARLGRALRALAREWRSCAREQLTLDRITTRMNAGLVLGDILQSIYEDFKELIPYERIGCALLDESRESVRAYWARSEQPEVHLAVGYTAPLAGSSLETILATGEPRILNDLVDYLAHKPGSHSTRLIVSEGFRSSLTCPLIANGVPIGFMFFSSLRPNAYAGAHVAIYKRLAEQVSVIVEKGRLTAELVERKAALERQNEELRRLSDLKNTFVGMAAHDLRNPIATIQMMADVLLSSRIDLSGAEQRELLADMALRTRGMMAMLDELLDVTQIEAGKLELHLEAVVLPEFLEEVVRRHAALATPKGTRVLLESAPRGILEADPVRLGQALDNLVSNAVKYSPPGSIVRVSAVRPRDAWRFHVRDEGPGILPGDRARLFTDFARLSARPTGDERSTGLGLAITRRVIEAHGGTIGVESEPGHGADFWFSLPDRAPESGE